MSSSRDHPEVTADTRLPLVATTHSLVGFTTCACLLVFYAAGEPFGVINDIGNAALGLLSLAVAWFLPPTSPPRTAAPRSPSAPDFPRRRVLLLGIAGVGALLTVVGTVFVLAGITGFYLAG